MVFLHAHFMEPFHAIATFYPSNFIVFCLHVVGCSAVAEQWNLLYCILTESLDAGSS